MKILVVHEAGSGRDGQVRIQSISRLIRAANPESEIFLSIKESPEIRYYNSRHINKIEMCPVDNFHLHRGNSAQDYLLNSFFKSASDTNAFTKHWDDLLRKINPDVIIADNAPSAALVAATKAIPLIQVSDGFNHLVFEDQDMAISAQSRTTILSDVALSNLEKSPTMIANIPMFAKQTGDNLHYVHLDAEKDDDGGLPIDIFAYVKKSDPIANDILDALDTTNNEHGKKILVVMNGIEPINYKDNFELTPHFVRLQGALYGSPLVIQNFGSGLLLESIKNHCPVWGVALSKEQDRMKRRLMEHMPENITPRSRQDVLQSILRALEHRESNKEQAKKIWASSQKQGVQPISSKLIELLGAIT